MRITRQIRREAKRLFRLCVIDDVLDEARVRRLVNKIIDSGSRDRWALLRCLSHHVKRDRNEHAAIVESAVPLPAALQASVQHDLERLYGPGLNITFSERPEVIGGMRIRVGDNVYDGTVQARLAALERSL